MADNSHPTCNMASLGSGVRKRFLLTHPVTWFIVTSRYDTLSPPQPQRTQKQQPPSCRVEEAQRRRHPGCSCPLLLDILHRRPLEFVLAVLLGDLYLLCCSLLVRNSCLLITERPEDKRGKKAWLSDMTDSYMKRPFPAVTYASLGSATQHTRRKRRICFVIISPEG